MARYILRRLLLMILVLFGMSVITFGLTHIVPGNPARLTAMDGTLYFTAYQLETGVELWKSDGTAGGTVLVKDICPGPGRSFISRLMSPSLTYCGFLK